MVVGRGEAGVLVGGTLVVGGVYVCGKVRWKSGLGGCWSGEAGNVGQGGQKVG